MNYQQSHLKENHFLKIKKINMAKSINLEKLKEEIDSRTKEKGIKYGVNDGVTPKDKFLYGLLESLDHGHETQSTRLLKVVDNGASEILKEEKKYNVDEQAIVNKPSKQQLTKEEIRDREEQLYRDLENRRKMGLTDALSRDNRNSGTNILQPKKQLNESYLTEDVKNIVNGYLSENFGLIVEESIKNVIIEMYAIERIKEVLNENRDLIKSVVIETIRELQAKKLKK